MTSLSLGLSTNSHVEFFLMTEISSSIAFFQATSYIASSKLFDSMTQKLQLPYASLSRLIIIGVELGVDACDCGDEGLAYDCGDEELAS